METPAATPSLALRGQYIKDLSFESPRAPASLLSMRQAPGIDVGIDLNAQRLQENLFELTLRISARALHEKSTLFLVDLAYGGLFELNGIPEDKLEEVVLVECAFMLFPFARRVVADITRDGGFPPFQMEPVDFRTLYINNRGQVNRGEAASA